MGMIELKRGDVAWLKLPQTLASLEVARDLPYKIRPFLIMNESLPLQTDHNSLCKQNRKIIGIDCTSKDYLVAGRPHLSFSMPGSERKGTTTYTMVDGLREVSSYDQKLKVAFHLSAEQMKDVAASLSAALQPEQRFFLSGLFNRRSAFMPGEIWRINTINASGEALILLRRGAFVASENVEDSRNLDRARQSIRKSPYIIAFFPKAQGVKTLRGMTWNDMQIMAVQENCFIEKTASLMPATSANLMNAVRKVVGLPPFEYKEPVFKNFLGMSALRLSMPFGMR